MLVASVWGQVRVHTHETESRDHYTSNTLIGGKGGASPSSLHIIIEGPTEYVNARWMLTPKGTGVF